MFPRVPYQSTQSVKDVAQNQRDLINQRGDILNQTQEDSANWNGLQAGGYQGFLDPLEQQLASGNGGYAPEEQAQIQGQTGQYGLNNLPTSADQLQSNFLTPQEQQGIQGNTASYTDYFNPAQIQSDLTGNQGTQNQVVQNLNSNLTGAIDPTQLSQSDAYTAKTGGQVRNNQTGFLNTLSGEAGNVRGAINAPLLQQDKGAAQTEVMTPEQQQQLVTAAGISAGARNQAAVGALERQARAAGTNPLGVAAYRQRMNTESAAQAGDAMTQARVAAQQARAQEQLASEQQRLGAQQGLTNVQTGTELQMGGQALQGQQALGQQALNQANLEEQQRMGGQQYLTGARLQAATTGGEAALQNAQQMTGQQLQEAQYAANTGTGIRQAQDVAGSQRAGQLATNRQATGEGNQATQFGQGFQVNQAGSQRGQTIGQARMGQQQFGLQGQTGQEQQYNQNQQNAYNRQQQNYGTQASAGNQAGYLSQAANSNPTTFDKVVGGIAGGLGAAASFLADGDIVDKPTLAVIGENGPERVSKVQDYRSSRYASKQMPSRPFTRRPYAA